MYLQCPLLVYVIEMRQRRLTSRARAWLAGYAAVAVAQVLAEGNGSETAALVLVVLAMPVLAGVLLSSGVAHDRFGFLVLLALGFSWLGDWVGDIAQPHIVVKIIFFFVGHLCFIAAFWPLRGRSVLRRPVVVLGYVVVIAALLVWVVPNTGRLGPAMIIYAITLGVMAVLATGVDRSAGIGGALFVISDLSIAVLFFVLPGLVQQPGVIIMSTYLVAQLLIVFGVIASTAVEHDLELTPPSAATVGS